MDSTPDSQNKRPSSHHHHERRASPSDLLADAKMLAGAVRSGKVDKSKASEAAEDLLAAVSDYGKLGEGQYGSYVQKAETYLHKYHGGDDSTTNLDSHSTTHANKPNHPPTSNPSKYDDDDEGDDGNSGKTGGGFGDYLKMAQGFMNKQ